MDTTNYNNFSRFYDLIMGDREKTLHDLSGLIKKHAPDAKKVLDLGCGTGTLLKQLGGKYEMHGLDLSFEMLEIARQKFPKGKLYQQDMTKFSIDEKFDVIYSVFDTMNHLDRIKDWRNAFKKSHEHLAQDGVFIFDINTLHKLQTYSIDKPGVLEFDGNVLIMNVIDVGGNYFNWNVKVFEKVKDNDYKLYEENIEETSFPLKKIKDELLKTFKKVQLVDFEKTRATEKSKRVYFICKK